MNENELLSVLPKKKCDAVCVSELCVVLCEHRQGLNRKLLKLFKYGFICCETRERDNNVKPTNFFWVGTEEERNGIGGVLSCVKKKEKVVLWKRTMSFLLVLLVLLGSVGVCCCLWFF